MAANIPQPLKSADITRFVHRAAQLEKAKPVIAYWCDYWVVNQILGKQLHNQDQECLQFTMALMDKLEQTKAEQANNDAIMDDTAGQAYVEQFAQEVFDKADRVVKANKVTRQTADTFDAAATFFQLINVWGQPDEEVQKKIKYAKWNTLRIIKAVKEGNDPNESNPKQEEERPASPVLDPNDPEVRALEASKPQPPTVEEVQDEGEGLKPARQPFPVSAETSPLPPGTAPAHEQVSPIVPGDQPGSYFPNVRQSVEDDPLVLPSTTDMPPPGGDDDPPVEIPSPSSHDPSAPPVATIYPPPPDLPSTPQNFGNPTSPPPAASAPPPSVPTPQPPPVAQPRATAPPPAAFRPSQPTPPVVPVVPASQPHVNQQYGSSGPPAPSNYVTDDMAMAQAQKHAKWAISALNFEDVPTAVRELEAALKTLGAR